MIEPIARHKYSPKARFDGGDLDCGNGLLFLIRKHLDPLNIGELLEISSTETSVEEELPAWCRLTHNDLVSWTKEGKQRSFLICKGNFSGASSVTPASSASPPAASVEAVKTAPSIEIVNAIASGRSKRPIGPLSCMGIGSWPRPQFLLPALEQYLEGKMTEAEFHHLADRAVRLAIGAQVECGVDVISDGEQRRDNYASFVGKRLDNCQLIPLTDLLPLIDHPEEFEEEMHSLDVPADKIRHPAVLGRIVRKEPLVLHEYLFARQCTDLPIKVALPGPYLLTRMMWLSCISNKIYANREELAKDLVIVLRSEITDILAHGVDIVQLDEPILTEVVFSGKRKSRSFMCGALSDKGDSASELQFAERLINEVLEGMPREKTAIHICRGNWTPDESVALTGGYEPLLPILGNLQVGTMFLEFCTERAGSLDVLKALPPAVRVGVGVVNPKSAQVETLEQVLACAQRAIDLIGKERVLLTPDCGFATFADNPTTSESIARAKLAVIAKAKSKLVDC